MSRELRDQDVQCSIAQAAAVVGDWWSLLIVREVARGHRRFEELLAELGISRKVLTERLKHLVEHGVLVREPYQVGPLRHEYVLTSAGWALAPVLISMQDWADRWLLGDGTLTGLPQSTETARVHALVGTRIPQPLALPATISPPTNGQPPRGSSVTTGPPIGEAPSTDGVPPVGGEPLIGRASSAGGELRDVVADAGATVLFGYPATGMPSPLPPGWGQLPGAAGCTLENRLFRDMAPRFAEHGVAIHGVSTQRPDEQAAFAAAEGIPFPLLSDVDLRLATALRLPTFRAGQALRLKRVILIADRTRVIRHAIFPITDIPVAVEEAHRTALTLT